MAEFEPPQFCERCGTALETREASGRMRPWCPRCGFVRYLNPAVGVAVVLQDETGRVLMGRRATGEYAGLWCIPCGYVEWEEEVRGAARREFAEETGLDVEIGGVVAVQSNFHNKAQHTVGVWFAGTVVGGELRPVDGEFSELTYIDPSEPPPLAFPTDGLVLAKLATARS